jgi:hypothetical protein
MDLVTNWLNIILSFVVANILPTALLLVIGIVVIVIIKKIVKTLLEKSKLEKAAHSLIKTVARVVQRSLWNSSTVLPAVSRKAIQVVYKGSSTVWDQRSVALA